MIPAFIDIYDVFTEAAILPACRFFSSRVESLLGRLFEQWQILLFHDSSPAYRFLDEAVSLMRLGGFRMTHLLLHFLKANLR